MAGESQPHYLVLADRYKAQVQPPPHGPTFMIVNESVGGFHDDSKGIVHHKMSFSVQPDFRIVDITIDATVTAAGDFAFGVTGTTFFRPSKINLAPGDKFGLLISEYDKTPFLQGSTGEQSVFSSLIRLIARPSLCLSERS